MATPKPRRSKDNPLVILAWGLNIFGLCAVALVFVAYWAMKPVHAATQAPQPQYTATMPPTFTPDAFSLNLPTITPNPRSTMIRAGHGFGISREIVNAAPGAELCPHSLSDFVVVKEP